MAFDYPPGTKWRTIRQWPSRDKTWSVIVGQEGCDYWLEVGKICRLRKDGVSKTWVDWRQQM